jgi:hypothetical protein
LTTKTKPKKEFKAPDAKHTQLVLWTEPDSTPRAPRTRILLMVAMHLFCASGARIGALFPKAKSKTKGLRYRVSKPRPLPYPGTDET